MSFISNRVMSALVLGSLFTLSACQNPFVNTQGTPEIFGPMVDAGVDPGLTPKSLTYTDIRQHSFARAGADFDSVVSRDGKYILFASTRHTVTPDIYIKPVHGPTVTKKTIDGSSDLHPAFSPKGDIFAFSSNRNGNWDIFLMKSFSASTPQQITRSMRDEIHPHFHPDGTKLVYCAFSEMANQWEIWVHDFKTQQDSVMGVGLFPQWSPDGKKILFQRARQRGTRWYSVWQMDATGDNVTEIIADNDWAAINPSYSADGKHIVFATVAKSPATAKKFFNGDDIWMVRTDGTNLIRLTTHVKPDWNPTWGPDGRVYFTSQRNGYTNIWSAKPIAIDVVPDMRRQSAMSDSGMPAPATQPEHMMVPGMGTGMAPAGGSVDIPKKLARP